jgi:carbon starvation protein
MAFAVRRAKLGVAVFLVHSGWNHKMKNNNSLARHIPWLLLAIVGACALGVVALRRGEAINALWIVVAAVAIYLVAYRYYSLFIANNVMQLDPRRATPAVLNNDGLDYVPTNKHILFGHHFAAIAGAGPLVGPVLAAQFRTSWSCSCPPAATVVPWATWSVKKWAAFPAPLRCLAAS